MLFSVGGYETIADNSWTFAEKARAAGVDATVEETPERQHVFQFACGRHPDADASLARIGAWLGKQLGL
jgi:acetyl esterase/lipase